MELAFGLALPSGITLGHSAGIGAGASFSVHHKRLCHRAPPARMCASASASPDDAAPTPRGDWREVRAGLHYGSAAAFEAASAKCYRPGYWAHPLSKPEAGCFLASHPALYRPQTPYLTQAVIFLVEHSNTKGSTGLVLNRPLQGTLQDLTVEGALRSVAIPADAARAYNNDYVYVGGPHLYEGESLVVLESVEGRTRTESRIWTESRPEVQVASLEACFKGRKGVEASPPVGPIRLFAGCVKWGAGRLDAEVENGEWYVCSASAKYATSHCIQLPKPLWRELMESSGDETYAKIARKVYNDE